MEQFWVTGLWAGYVAWSGGKKETLHISFRASFDLFGQIGQIVTSAVFRYRHFRAE